MSNIRVVYTRSDKKTDEINYNDRARRCVMWWHIAAGSVHLASFAAILITLLVVDDPLKGRVFSDTFDRVSVENKDLREDGYSLGWVLVWMPLITSLFHFFQAFIMGQPKWGMFSEYITDVINGVNIIRWIEYSMTASLMTWIVAQLSGITNVYLLWLLAAVCNVALQWHGYLHEMKIAGDAFNRSIVRRQWKTWIPFLNGSGLFLGQWMIIICYFIRSINAVDSVPWIVWVSFFSVLGTFMTFPVLQILFAFNVLVKTWKGYEIGFIILSLVSKLLLDWTLLIAIVTT